MAHAQVAKSLKKRRSVSVAGVAGEPAKKRQRHTNSQSARLRHQRKVVQDGLALTRCADQEDHVRAGESFDC